MKETLLSLKENLKNGHELQGIIENKILNKGDKLLYLIKKGSHLYGLDTKESDLDLIGITLPSKKSLLLNKPSNQYGGYSTGKDNISNNKEDIDLELWSVHKFFNLLRNGDTNAYDVLYSYPSDVVLFCERSFQHVFEFKSELTGSKPILNSFIGYSYGQVKRYEAKGFNFATLKSILRYFKNIEYEGSSRLGNYVDNLIEYVNKENKNLQLEVISDNKDTYLEINSYKKYPIGIRVKEFINSIQKWAKEYGSRVRNNDKGVDWKSLSHAFRVLRFAECLAMDGKFSYPFNKEEREGLLKIKNGEVDFKGSIVELKDYVEDVRYKLKNTNMLTNKVNNNILEELIFYLYEEFSYENY